MFAHRNRIAWEILELAFCTQRNFLEIHLSLFYTEVSTLRVTFFFFSSYPDSKSKVHSKDSRSSRSFPE